MAKTKNDQAWQKLFTDYNIITEIKQKGHYIIDSSLINQYRESRLMTKFDHKVNLPEIFKNNHLTILPVSRGTYIISYFDNYQKVKYQIEDNLYHKNFPSFIESINCNNIYSESAALHCANLTGIIEDLINEKIYYTVSGRMTTNKFNFRIKSSSKGLITVDVDRAQIEIDAGFESKNYFLLIEAKNISVEDFLIRQLYYPYRYWQSLLKKPVLPIFMTFSNDIFSFFVYRFTKEDEYNSLQLVKQKHYCLQSDQIMIEDIVNLFREIKIVKEPKVPFPQANSFFRVIDFLNLLNNKDLTKEDLALNYEFDIHKRQFDYYSNAVLYLGLAEKYNHKITKETTFTLSKRGQNIMSQHRKKKNLLIVEAILEHKVFNKTMSLYINKSRLPKKSEIIEIMNTCHIYNVESADTIKRRASTVLSWVKWIVSLAKP